MFLLPGALTVYAAFNAGGFFADGTAALAVLLALAITLRVTLAADPFAGLGRAAAAAVLFVAVLAGWTLASGAWSDSWARGLLEFDRVLVYGLALMLFALHPRTSKGLRLMLIGFGAAVVVVCAAGLASRLLPDLVPTSADIEPERLSYPVTYWNALGLLAALGIVTCGHLASDIRGRAIIRVLAAGSLPVLALTLYFTFSRGAILAAFVGLAAYLVLARPRGAISALLAAGPPTAVALVIAYNADRLSSSQPIGAAASEQADRVAIVAALAVLVAGLLRAALLVTDRRLDAVRIGPRVRRTASYVAGGALVAALVVAVVLGAPGAIERQYESFVEGSRVSTERDLRERLADPGNNGRLHYWEVALDAFREHPVAGQGAGTYELLWARGKPRTSDVVDGHSLYLELLAELGIVGLALLAAALLLVLVRLARLTRGEQGPLYGALLALMLVWVLHAGIDWDWEMPVVTLWLFAAAGVVLARAPGEGSVLARPGRLPRVLLGLCCLLLAVAPALVYLSQRSLNRGVDAFERRDCAKAVDAALESNGLLSTRPEPFELLGYCDVRLGRPDLGVRAMEEAVERDPGNWQLYYGLAVVRAAAGQDPRKQARLALTLNPRSPLTQDGVERFRGNDPQKWKRRALSARLPLR